MAHKREQIRPRWPSFTRRQGRRLSVTSGGLLAHGAHHGSCSALAVDPALPCNSGISDRDVQVGAISLEQQKIKLSEHARV